MFGFSNPIMQCTFQSDRMLDSVFGLLNFRGWHLLHFFLSAQTSCYLQQAISLHPQVLAVVVIPCAVALHMFMSALSAVTYMAASCVWLAINLSVKTLWGTEIIHPQLSRCCIDVVKLWEHKTRSPEGRERHVTQLSHWIYSKIKCAFAKRATWISS